MSYVNNGRNDSPGGTWTHNDAEKKQQSINLITRSEILSARNRFSIRTHTHIHTSPLLRLWSSRRRWNYLFIYSRLTAYRVKFAFACWRFCWTAIKVALQWWCAFCIFKSRFGFCGWLIRWSRVFLSCCRKWYRFVFIICVLLIMNLEGCGIIFQYHSWSFLYPFSLCIFYGDSLKIKMCTIIRIILKCNVILGLLFCKNTSDICLCNTI